MHSTEFAVKGAAWIAAKKANIANPDQIKFSYTETKNEEIDKDQDLSNKIKFEENSTFFDRDVKNRQAWNYDVNQNTDKVYLEWCSMKSSIKTFQSEREFTSTIKHLGCQANKCLKEMKDRREMIVRDQKVQNTVFDYINKVGQDDVDSCVKVLEAKKQARKKASKNG